jgi:hypothetical protein
MALERRTLTREAAAGAALRLVAATTSALLKVRGEDRTTARVSVSLEIHSDSAQEADEYAAQVGAGIHFDGETLTVKQPENSGASWRDLKRLEYEITVPQETSAEISCANGPIDLAGFSGPLQVSSANGPVAVEGVRSRVEVKLANGPARLSNCGPGLEASVTNGPLRLKDVAGPIRLDVANGPIHLEDGRGALVANVLNGPIHYAGAISGNLELTSRHGPITLRLPVGSRFELDAEAQHGVVRSDFDVAEGRPGPPGSHRLVLRSHWGDIRIQETAAAKV